MDTIDVAVYTVGGSPAPVIYSLQHHKPRKVMFFASKDSFSAIASEIMPACSFIELQETHILTDEQNLSLCIEEMQRAITLWVSQEKNSSIYGDFTGGTKVMSVALSLCLQPFGFPLSYIGGTRRHKNGLGQVQDGQEQVLVFSLAKGLPRI